VTAGPISRLALGTVQFGLAYGLAAGHKQVFSAEVEQILADALQSGIRLLDTAASYGESESVIGASEAARSFQVISKTLPIRQPVLTGAHLDQIKSAFAQSLTRLGRTRLEGLLVHDAQDLLAGGGDGLWTWMEGLKRDGVVARIGISIYDSETARLLAGRYAVDIVQIPFNLFDQRIMQDGFLDFCRSHSIAVHARSIFLQGVALMQADDLPANLTGLHPNLQRLETLAQTTQRSAADLALAYVAQWPEIEQIVAGVHHPSQLAQLVDAWLRLDSLKAEAIAWDDLHCTDNRLIDPRMWN
jgi:aryl-alcohol dehydrogenase-like predicted oxidoreductase